MLGGPFIVMERKPGRMLLSAMFDGGSLIPRLPALVVDALVRVPRTLGREQARLHEVDPEPLLRAFEAASIPRHLYTLTGWIERLRARVDASDLEGLRPLLDWVADQRPPEPVRLAICHCDFLPPNVLADGDEVVGLVDWSHLTLADPVWDVANTRLRLAMNPIDLPAVLQPLASLLRGRMTRAYETAYTARRPLERDLLGYYESLLALWFLVEIAELRAHGQPSDGRAPNLWTRASATRRLTAHVRRLTGLRLDPDSDELAS